MYFSFNATQLLSDLSLTQANQLCCLEEAFLCCVSGTLGSSESPKSSLLLLCHSMP